MLNSPGVPHLEVGYVKDPRGHFMWVGGFVRSTFIWGGAKNS